MKLEHFYKTAQFVEWKSRTLYEIGSPKILQNNKKLNENLDSETFIVKILIDLKKFY